MTAVRLLATVGLVAMAAVLAYGFGRGDGWTEVAALMAYPWFVVSLVDVYVGFAFVAVWIVFREPRLPVAASWVIAILLLGNLVSCGYALLALHASRGDWSRFWMGHRASAR